MDNTYPKISQSIAHHVSQVESSLSLSDITIKYGLNSYRYGSSEFLEELFVPLDLTDPKVFYDLGSGYGKVIIYGAMHHPDCCFKGIEIVEERANAAKEIIEHLSLNNAFSICGDILAEHISDGDIFYLYNPLHEFQYAHILERLKNIADTKPITVIAESKCDVFDRADWLTQYHYTNIDFIRKIKYYHNQITSS